MGSSKKASGDHVSEAGPDSPCRKAREEGVNDVYLPGDSAVAVNSFILNLSYKNTGDALSQTS